MLLQKLLHKSEVSPYLQRGKKIAALLNPTPQKMKSKKIIPILLLVIVVAIVYLIFLLATFTEMPEGFSPDKRVLGIYGVCFLALVVIYFFLFMISSSQTPGMKRSQLVAVTQEGSPLDPSRACMRGFGYLVSILPLMLGFFWALIDLEHLTWADKVSGTYIKKI